MSAEWTEKEAEEVLERFKKEMESLKDREVPPGVASFMELVERLRNDEEALENFRKEILKNYGE
tara:strand:- start:430 stop:621 length:192 start_codon:yes stop_codon:yes gene_type:complete